MVEEKEKKTGDVKDSRLESELLEMEILLAQMLLERNFNLVGGLNHQGLTEEEESVIKEVGWHEEREFLGREEKREREEEYWRTVERINRKGWDVNRKKQKTDREELKRKRCARIMKIDLKFEKIREN